MPHHNPAPFPAESSPGKGRKVVHHALIAGILLLSAYLLITGLGHAAFWDDEAEVGIVARNFLNTHTLTGFDGRNLLAYRNGTTLDAHLMSRQPPLMFYVAAAGFWLLGVSEFAGRLPFTVLAFLSLLLYARILRRDFGGQPLTFLYSLAVFGLSSNFLLNGRQCRYYSLALFFGLLVYDLYGATRLLLGAHSGTGPTRRQVQLLVNLTLLGLATVGLFFSHFLLAAAFLAALGVVHGVPRLRRTIAQADTTTPVHYRQAYWLLPFAIFSLFCLPYCIRHRPWERPDLLLDGIPWWSAAKDKLWDLLDYLFSINGTNMLPAVGALGLWLAFRRRAAGYDNPAKPMLLRWLGMAVLYPVFLAIFGPPGGASDRYLILTLPFASGCLGLWLAHLHKQRSPYLGLAGLLALVCSNILAVPSAFINYTLLLPRYLLEIHQPYPTASEAAARALRKYAREDDGVLALPSFQSLPLIFYVGDKVRLCGLLDAKARLPLESALAANPCLMVDQNAPQWIVMYGAVKPLQEQLKERGFSRPNEMATRYAVFADLNIYYLDTQRAEPRGHSFGPQRSFQPSRSVYLLKRRD